MIDFNEALAKAARDCPANAYLWHKTACISFAELVPALSRIASQLPVLAGHRIIIFLPDSLNAALLHLACFRQGATLVPVSPFAPATLLQHIMGRFRPDVVFTTPILQAKLAGLLQETATVLVTERVPDRLQFVNAKYLRDGRDRPSPVRAVLFTSGTTGAPKGVCLSESNLLSAAMINCAILRLDSSRRSLITVPLYDYYGMIQIYAHALAKAACSVGESGQFPKSAFEMIGKQSITDIVLVPFTLKALLGFAESDYGREYRTALNNVAFAASSSDQLSADLLERAFALNPNLTVVNVYGLTEAGRACYRVIRAGSRRSNSIGNASPMMKVWVDAECGSRGEIVISGPTVMLGYLQDIIDRHIQFAPVTEIKTADEGYTGDDNEIHLLGRKDHLINMYGEKLHPSEIELSVNELPGVKNSLARFSKDGNGRGKVVLDVVADDSTAVTKQQIMDLLRKRVPRLFLPEVIKFVDVIERTEIGSKVIRPK
jgi:acyl-CoA synthetase (AMP-forming)/AMP-acid ligase II